MTADFAAKPTKKASIFDLPYVLFMGPQRAGTSWLDRYLRSRGDICLPLSVKEVFFYDRHFERGVDFYKKHFKPAANHDLVSEVSTTAFDAKEAPSRVYELFKQDIKLVCPLRNPIERSYSLYKHYLRYGIVRGTLREACFHVPQIIDSSRYAKHLEYWFDYFPREKILIAFQEELEGDQEKFLKHICNYLDLPYIAPAADIQKRYNVTTASSSKSLAWAAQNAASLLRDHRLHFIVNSAKSMGLKNLVFGEEKAEALPIEMSKEDRMWLEDQLFEQMELLEKMIGPVKAWRSS